MKILHIITSLRTGGAEKLVRDMLPLMRDEGHTVEVAVFDGTPTHLLTSLKEHGISIHILGIGLKSAYNPLHIKKLTSLMGGVNIVHSHNTSAQLFAALAAPSGTALVTTEHNTDNRRRHLPLLRHLDRRLYRRYDAIACCSEAVASSLRAYLGPEFNARTSVIENGIDLTAFAPPESETKDTDILMVAAFRPQKDHLTALRALTLLPPEVTISFAGDGATRSQIEAEVRRLGLENRVRFLGSVSDVPNRLHTAKIALLSTHYEGLSLSTIEAMASGTPLVASDVRGVREVCAEAAMLFPDGDAEALASILADLLKDPALRRLTAARCRERALRFDIRSTTQAYLDLYTRLLTSPRQVHND